MRVTFVSIVGEALGLQYLSAALKKKGHKTFLAYDTSLFCDYVVFSSPHLAKIFSYQKGLIRDILNSEPELICFSVLKETYQWALKIATEIKKNKNLPIIFGGTHPTILPELVISNECVDMICLGEGDEAIVELIETMESGEENYNIQNIWFKKNGQIIRNNLRPLIQDLDCLPFPDRSIYEPYIDPQSNYSSMSLRGCLFSCTYCSNNILRKIFVGLGPFVRRRSPENFLEELIYAKKKYDFKFLRIYDDIFTHDVKWLEEFIPEYRKRINRPFFCLGHPLCLSEEAIKLLKEGGCDWIQIGVQTFDSKTREKIISRMEKEETILEMISNLEKYKLRYQLDIIFGLPGDTESSYRHAVDIFKKCRVIRKVNTNTLTYVPKTRIIDTAIEENKLNHRYIKNIEHGFDGCQVGSGSITDKIFFKMVNNYLMMFKLAMFLPPTMVDFLMDRGLFKILRFIKPILLPIIRYIRRDKTDRILIHSFLRDLTRWVKWKIKDLLLSKS